ncbi:ferritin-like fold-containing protein [Jiangella asiatica]|uniref:ferritin-like fold-containing protein n=1 Tax=Jiangella asiatica TaxID=2530372 RepID=UPI0026AED3AD
MSVTATDGFDDPAYRDGIVDLLGLLGLGELTGFERMAADAGLAPTLADKAALAGMAVTEFHHFEHIRDRLGELGASVDEAMAPFRDALEQFHANTAPADWLEGLVKAYVGDGIAADFYREVAEEVDPLTRQLVLEVLADAGHADFAVERVREAIAADSRVAGRLALWARRLVGEALAQAQRVAVDRDALAVLVVGGAGRAGLDLAEIGQLFARITRKHADRMTKLGLSP